VTGAALARTALVLLGALLLQLTVGLSIVIGGAHPDVLLVLPIVTALVAGPTEGAVMGFVAGLVADLFVPAPFGLSALVGCLVGGAVGFVVPYSDRSPWWVPPVVALAASAGAVMLYAVLGAVLGDEQFLKLNLGAIVAVVAVTNALLAVPALSVLRWSLGLSGAEGRRAAGGRW